MLYSTMPRLTFFLFKISIVCLLISCNPKTTEFKVLENPDFFREAVQNLTDISVYDIFPPCCIQGLCLSKYCGI